MVDLPAPDGPTIAQAGARRNVEVEAFQDLAAGVVAEAQALEANLAFGDAQGPGAGLVDDFGGRIEQVPHRLHVDQALADGTIDPAEHVEWAEQLHQQRIDQHHVARGEAALAPAPHGEDHRPGHHRVGDQRLADVEPGERHFVADGGAGIGADGFIVALGLALLGAEIFDRFVVEQRIDGAADRLVVDVVHLALDVRAPVGDLAREGDVDGHHRQRRGDQPGAELDQEDAADRDQLDHGRGDIEQQEIEHHVDALGAALDDLGQRPGPPFEVEAQRQIVDVAEHLARQPSRRVLSDFLEQGVAQIVRQNAGEARAWRSPRPGPRRPRTGRCRRTCGRSPPCRRRASARSRPCRQGPAARPPRRAPSARSAPSATASAGSATAPRSRRCGWVAGLFAGPPSRST